MNFVVLALAAALVTMAVIFFWLKFGVGMPLDRANHRSLHVGAIPRIGGVAMVAGVAASVLLTSFAPPLVVPLLAALALFVFSSLDDWRSLPALPRLLGHLMAAVAVVAALPLPWVWLVPAALMVTWMTNLYNFMDGADGLAGGMAVIGFGACGVAAMSPMPAMASLCFAIAGAAAGFLAFNFPPARVFMGDAGSIPLGFLAGALGLTGWHAGIWSVWFPALVFSPFIVDATVTLWRRLLRRERVWQAHREHAYQQLALAGWSRRRLVWSAWGLMVATAITALVIRNRSTYWQGFTLSGWIMIYVFIMVRVDRYRRCRSTVAASPEMPNGG